MPDKFEYRTVNIHADGSGVDSVEADAVLNEMGKEGWDLHSVAPVQAGGATSSLVYTFRRLAESERKVGFTR